MNTTPTSSLPPRGVLAPTPQPGASQRTRVTFWAASAVLAALHVLLVNYFVPFRAVFSRSPLQGVDYDLHVGQVWRVVSALDVWGKTWLYDVHLLAGQPEGTILDSASKAWELWTFALYRMGVQKAVAFNSFVLVIMLSCPALIYAAARGCRLSPNTSLVAAAMASTLWFFDSHVHWSWSVGMVSWAGAACLATLTLAQFLTWLSTGRAAAAVLCGTCLSLGLLIHPYSFFALAPSMAVAYLAQARALPARRQLVVLAIAFSPIAVNAYWLHNAFRHWHYVLDSAYFAQAAPEYFLCDALDLLCSGADTGVIGTRTGFRWLYLGMAVAWFALSFRRRDPRYLPLLAGVSVPYVLAYLGNFIPGMQQTQPYRQITPASLLSVIPAAAFLDWVWRQGASDRVPHAIKALLVVLSFALGQQLLAGQMLYFFAKLVPEPKPLLNDLPEPLNAYGYLQHPSHLSHVDYGVPHEAKFEPAAIDATVDWFSKNVPAGTRVLVDNGVLGERMAWRTDLEIIGGFLERNLEHAYANYFRVYKDTPPPDQIRHYLRTFAISWVVSDRTDFALVPDILEPLTILGGVTLYRARAPVSPILLGTGHAHASENRIEVRGSRPSEPLLLSYHWHEALRCKPNCRIERQRMDIDRVGFIRIPAPHSADLVIWNGY